MSKKIGRNDPCVCGSGRKFKHCCAGKGVGTHRRKYVLYLLLFSGVVAASIVPAYKSWKSRNGQASEVSTTKKFRLPPVSRVPTEGSGTKTRSSPQPPGPVPNGKVWSPEHGHWHNAPGANVAAEGSSSQTRSSPQPQPPGPIPEGKVWSPEHGHWHNAAVEAAKAERAAKQSSAGSSSSVDQHPLDLASKDKVRPVEFGDLLEESFTAAKAQHATKAPSPPSPGPTDQQPPDLAPDGKEDPAPPSDP